MLSQLKSMIPGAERWPIFVRNLSEQFEARLSIVEVQENPSIFFNDMQGSQIPIVVAHGEGQAYFCSSNQNSKENLNHLINQKLITLQYIDHYGKITTQYPFNPNGSPLGITGLTTEDGRVTIMMPHPERVFRSVQYSWHPDDWQEDGPWLQIFRNARVWVG